MPVITTSASLLAINTRSYTTAFQHGHLISEVIHSTEPNHSHSGWVEGEGVEKMVAINVDSRYGDQHQRNCNPSEMNTLTGTRPTWMLFFYSRINIDF